MAEELYTYYAIANSNEIPEGDRLFIEVNGHSIVVFNIGGQLYAIEDVCTHDHGPLGDGEVDGFEVILPSPRSTFRCAQWKGYTLAGCSTHSILSCPS